MGDDDLAGRFHEAVTMTSEQLRDWLGTEESRSVGQGGEDGESTGHASGRRIVQILDKPEGDLDDDDREQMQRTVAYVHRHLAQRPGKEDLATSRWRYSLMNWGHDPLAG